MKQNQGALQQELLRQLNAGGNITLIFSTDSHVKPMSLVGFLANRGIAASYVQKNGYVKLTANRNPNTGDAA